MWLQGRKKPQNLSSVQDHFNPFSYYFEFVPQDLNVLDLCLRHKPLLFPIFFLKVELKRLQAILTLIAIFFICM